MDVDDAIHGISTLVWAQLTEGPSQGSGFFFQELEDKDPNKTFQWVRIKGVWLVTNRHVILPRIDGAEVIPDALTFNLRKVEGGRIVWAPITLPKSDLLSRAKFDPNPDVDVCAIHVQDVLEARVRSGEGYLPWYGVSKDDFPGSNKIYPHVASDVVIVGYPRGYYDAVNLYPIAKSGMIATRWGSNFNGNPYFLIDAKLFPGSSGSIVISKPIDVVVENNQIYASKEKQFAFLGVFSGEPYQHHQPLEFDDLTLIRKLGFNLGIVWYASLVEEIIHHGVNLVVS